MSDDVETFSDVEQAAWLQHGPNVVKMQYSLEEAPDVIAKSIAQELELNSMSVANDCRKTVFLAGGRLSRISTEEIDNQIRYAIKSFKVPGLQGRLAELANWISIRGELVNPPVSAVENVMERADELCGNLPVLEQIITYPTYSVSGVLQLQPGYSSQTKCWYVPPVGVEIPVVSDAPTDEEMTEARGLIIDELLHDFPFVSVADRANAVAMMLQPFVRRVIPGPTPVHAIDAPKAGTGKTLLTNLSLGIAYGMPVASSTQSMSEEEWKKQLTTLMMTGRPFLFLDNLNLPLDSGHFASTITAGIYQERILGGNTECVRPVRHTWVVTGNNISYSDELARRTIPSYMNAHSETPQMGRVFRHDNVEEWARHNRGRLIWACLTLIQRWIADGKKRWTQRRLGMFEGWSEVMGGILERAGIEGFIDNLKDFYTDAIITAEEDGPFVRAWYMEFGEKEVVAKDLIQLATDHLELTKQIAGITPKPSSRAVGKYLARIKKKIFSGIEVIHVPKKGAAAHWKVVKIGTAGATGGIDGESESIVTNLESIVTNSQSIVINVETDKRSNWL